MEIIPNVIEKTYNGKDEQFMHIKEVDLLVRSAIRESESNGFSKGLRVEIHIAVPFEQMKNFKLTNEAKNEIILSIKNQLKN